MLYSMFEQAKRRLAANGGKIAGICLGICILISTFLLGYSMAYTPACERSHLEEIDRDYDCVPEGAMALELAGASVGFENNWTLQEDFAYAAECTYNEERYEWIVIFTPQQGETGGKRVVGIRRDIGLITIYQ